MFCIVYLKDHFWHLFTNEVWLTRKDAEEYAKRNNFKEGDKWKVVWYSKKYKI